MAERGEGQEAPDPGAVLLGSALFGVVAGCSAAGVAEALASPKTRSYHIDESADASPVTVVPSVPRMSSDQISARAELQGVVVQWTGSPREHPSTVAMRFQHPVRSAPAPCHELQITIDGQAHSYPLADITDASAARLLRTMQAQVDLEVLAHAQEGRQVELQLCNLVRRFSLAARESNKEFVRRFRARISEIDHPTGSASPAPATPTANAAPVTDAQPTPAQPPEPATLAPAAAATPIR